MGTLSHPLRDGVIFTVGAVEESFDALASVMLRAGTPAMAWSAADRTARYLASLVGELFPKAAPTLDIALNELLENALKFREEGDVEVTVGWRSAAMVCVVSNQVRAARVPALCKVLAASVAADPGETLRLRAEAQGGRGDSKSGLGFAMLRGDHQVMLGWSLTLVSTEWARVRASACISLES